MFGINLPEFTVIAVIALIVIGPERLPRYAETLGRLVRDGRRMAMGLREQVREEIGPEFDDVDWRKLDPRQYDPRRIVKEALSDTFEDVVPKAPAKRAAGGATAGAAGTKAVSGPGPAGAGKDGGPDLTKRTPGSGSGTTGRGTTEPAAPFDDDAT